MRKFFALLSLICVGVLTANAASLPKATGDASWLQPYSGAFAPATGELTFNALKTAAVPAGTIAPAKGSILYDDPYYTFTADVQFMSVNGNIAYFIGQVTSIKFEGGTTSASLGCCGVGDWVYYEVIDNGEPGVGHDQLSGMSLASIGITTPAAAKNYMANNPPQWGLYTITDGNIQVH